MSHDRDALRAWLQLFGAANAIKKSSDAKFREQFGHSIARFDVLAALDWAGDKGLRAGALTQRLMVSDGNTTQVAAPLLREGLIRRRISRDDGRVAIFKLTKRGQRLFDEMAAAHRRWIDEAFDNFSPQQLETFRVLLNRINLPIAIDGKDKEAA